MSQTNPLQSIVTSSLPPSAQPLPTLPDYSAQPHQGVHPLRKLHLLLRGRYLWAVSLGFLGLVGGGLGGYLVLSPQYTSSGVLGITPTVPVVLGQTDNQVGLGSMFESFVRSQAAMIESRRVINDAMSSDLWRSVKRGNTDEDVRLFISQVYVKPDPRSQVIYVNFTDGDPDVATKGARAIVQSYLDIYKDQDVQSENNRLSILQDVLNSKTSQAEDLSRQIRDLAQPFGTDDLQPLLTNTLQEIQRLRSELRGLELATATSRRAAGDPESPTPTIDPLAIAALDPQMRGYLDQKRTLEATIAAGAARYGPNHRMVREQQRSLEALNGIIERYAQDFARINGGGAPGVSPGLAAGGPENLLARQSTLQVQIQQLEEEKLNLSEKNSKLTDLKRQLERVTEERDSTRKRYDLINTESRISGRISPISSGERPLEPSNSSKRKQLGLLGGIGGGSLGVGIILILGLMDRRLKTSEDVTRSVRKIRMLGILPLLPDDLTDPEQAAVAAYAVHHVRTMLQLGHGGVHKRIFAVTSPTPGTGKTSLSFALGLSFAHCGARTLLIDADIVGAGLTARSEATIHPRLGQILLEKKLITAPQLEVALERSRQTGHKIGETLVMQGVVNVGQIESALRAQTQTLIGLLDVLKGKCELQTCVKELALPDLHVLPVGSAQIHQASTLSPRSVQKLIDLAKELYDIVIFDTGPILGSLEASVVAAHVDGVVLTVSRGEQRPMAERAADHLDSVGATLAGLVFNRAEEQDVIRSSYASMQSARAGGSLSILLDPAAARRPHPNARLFGPIASAVASQSGQQDNGENGKHA
ncbi:MAG: AAA family ATPase [Phycisphaeraceae bacterium]|nr:AAA family ATPase [Phycisphaeraceae bacterium]